MKTGKVIVGAYAHKDGAVGKSCGLQGAAYEGLLERVTSALNKLSSRDGGARMSEMVEALEKETKGQHPRVAVFAAMLTGVHHGEYLARKAMGIFDGIK